MCVIVPLTDLGQYLKTVHCPQVLGQSPGKWEKQLACVGTRHCDWSNSHGSSQSSSGQPIQILNLLKILDNVGTLCYLHRYTVNYRKKSGNVLLQFYAVSFIMKFLIFLRPWGKHLKCKACFFHAFYACVLEKLFSREVQNSPDSDGRSVHKLPVKTVQLTCAVFLLF